MTPDEIRKAVADAPALSIRQPWPWCIIHAGKDVENRDWPTSLRGLVLIHASKGMTRTEYEDCLDDCHRISRERPFPAGLTMPAFDDLPRGGIVGIMEIVGCANHSTSPWFQGKYGFMIRNAAPLPFMPCKGALGFFHPEIDRVQLWDAVKQARVPKAAP